ncbi:helix-turn-helix domain-containing protein [Megasphaera elsdenii]|uniref:helix-turn-helix domain-containing protein n=1 Tax=Megasphaera elsdenii TaxID=907 RepID=UPI0035C71C4D
MTNDNSYGEAALKYRISYQQVYQWARKYRQMGKAGLQDRRGKRIGSMPSRTPEEALRDCLAELEHQNRMIRIERDVLKNAGPREEGCYGYTRRHVNTKR